MCFLWGNLSKLNGFYGVLKKPLHYILNLFSKNYKRFSKNSNIFHGRGGEIKKCGQNHKFSLTKRGDIYIILYVFVRLYTRIQTQQLEKDVLHHLNDGYITNPFKLGKQCRQLQVDNIAVIYSDLVQVIFALCASGIFR